MRSPPRDESGDVVDPAEGAEDGANTVIRRVVQRETGRLQLRGRRLLTRLDELIDRYPSAARLVDDVEAAVRAHRRFISTINSVDWRRAAERTRRQLAEVVGGSDTGETVDLRWDDHYGGFGADVDGPGWQVRRRGAMVEVTDVVFGAIDDGDDEAGNIRLLLRSKKKEVRHEAVVRAVAWALMVQACHRYLDETQQLQCIRLYYGEITVRLTGSAREQMEAIPDATSFGYDPGGELFRRMEDFDQTDARAHWIRWMGESPRARREVRQLRNSAGARLDVEIDRSLRRLRLVEQAESKVVRKRKHVFVDEVPAESRDRLFATDDGLQRAAEEVIRGRIDDGFRVVYQRLEFDDRVVEQRR